MWVEVGVIRRLYLEDPQRKKVIWSDYSNKAPADMLRSNRCLIIRVNRGFLWVTDHLSGKITVHGQVTDHLSGKITVHGQVTDHLSGKITVHGQVLL